MSAVALVLDPASVTETTDYLEEAREKILAAVRTGMQEAMEGLAGEAVSMMSAAGIHQRTGELAENIEDSPKVTETKEVIRGTVSAERDITLGGRKSKHVGLWMEEGYHVPEVTGKLFQFTDADWDTLYSRGHRAFDVKPHPFMDPALREYETTITQIITDAVEGALA